MSKFLHDIP